MFFESFLLNLLVLLVLIVALVFDYVTKFFSYWYVRHVQYKMPLPFFGSDYHRVLGLRSNTDEVNNLYAKHPQEKYVGCIKSRIPDLIVKDPDALKKMLSTDFANFHSRGLGLDKSRDVCLRNNLFYAEGENWTLLREGLESLLNGMASNFEDSVRDCLTGINGDTNVQQLLSKVLDVVFKDLLLGSDFEQTLITDIRSEFQKRNFLDKINTYLKNIFPSLHVLLGLKTISEVKTNSIKSQLENSKLIREMKESGAVFQLPANRKVSRNNSESDYVFSIFSSFVSEGYIPCQNVLTALLNELALNQDLQNKTRSCQTKKISDEYLDNIIKETLRLHPPYSVVTRKCVKMYHYVEGNILIDRNVTIEVPIEAIHRDSKFYEKPEVFNPDRFSDDTTHSFSFLPFGAGPRKCVGEQLALAIIRTISKAILEKYDLKPSAKTAKALPVADHNFGRIIHRDIWLRFKPITA